MIKVKITANTSDPFLRQTEEGRGVWHDVVFVLDERDEGPFDAWFVLESMAKETRARCVKGNTGFVTYEPPGIRGYDRDFLRQFGALMTFRTDLKHSNVIRTHPLLPWWLGTCGGHGSKQVTRDFDALRAAVLPTKADVVSCVCSDKAITSDHRKRLQFVRALKERLGDRLLIFGPGFREWPQKWPDKWDSIAPFKYHLAIENSAHSDYWTEKVADTFLGGAFLIYWGCPNLSDYFPSESFVTVNRDDPDGAAATISRLIDAEQFAAARPAIAESRIRVLEKYNLFAELSECARRLPNGEVCEMEIKPENVFRNSLLKRVRRSVARRMGGVVGGHCDSDRGAGTNV